MTFALSCTLNYVAGGGRLFGLFRRCPVGIERTTWARSIVTKYVISRHAERNDDLHGGTDARLFSGTKVIVKRIRLNACPPG